jgi:WD40 repeat protein
MRLGVLSRLLVAVCLVVVGHALSAGGPPRADRGVRIVAFSADGKLLAAGTGEPDQEGTATVWDVATRKPLWTHREKKGIPAVAFTPDGKSLAIGSYDKSAKLLDVAGGKEKMQWQHPHEVRAVAIALDGKALATACWDGMVRVYDLDSGGLKATCQAPKDRLYRVQFSPDGKWLVSAGHEGGPKLWNAATGEEKRDFTFKHDGFFVPTALFSDDGRWLVTGGYDGTIRLWSLETGKMRAMFGGIGGVGTLDYSAAAGKLVANSSLFDLTFRDPTANELEQIKLLIARLDDDSYDVREATCKELLKMGFVAEPELRRAVKEEKSAEVRIRARQVRQQILNSPRTFFTPRSDVATVKFSPDGKFLASGGKDGVVRLTDINSAKEVAKFVAE